MLFHLFKFSSHYYIIEFPDIKYANKYLKVLNWYLFGDIEEPTHIASENIFSKENHISDLMVFKLEIQKMINKEEYFKFLPSSKSIIIRYNYIPEALKTILRYIEVI